MAKFRNTSEHGLDLKFLPGQPVVAPDAVFDVPDELVLDEGHSCTDDCTHPADARVYPRTLFARVGGTPKAEPDTAPPADQPA